MKSYGQLWQRIVSAENLELAWRRVKKGHSRSSGVVEFSKSAEKNLVELQKELLSGDYSPSGYHQFRIFDPKPRTISCAPVRDRIVHQALCHVITPLMEKSFVKVSFACRKGYGSHRACRLARRYAAKYKYFCKMDIRHYFDSIEHKILLEGLNRRFREPEVKALVLKIIESPVAGLQLGRGLPVGNLTSQWFANFYLDEFDHEVCRWFGKEAVAYIRYMDDFVFFANSKALLWSIHDRAVAWLFKQRGLEEKSEATMIAPIEEGLPFLGLRIFSGSWRLKHSRLVRTRRALAARLRQYECGELSDQRFGRCVASIEGGLRWFGFKNILASGRCAESGSSRVIRGFCHNNNGNNNNATSFYRYGGDPSSNRYNNNGNNTYLGFRLSSTLSGQCQGPARGAGASRIAKTNMHGDGWLVAHANATPKPNF